MSVNPPSTEAGADAVGILTSWLAEYVEDQQDEDSTFHRKFLAERIKRLRTLIAAIPDIEVESVTLTRLGTPPGEARDLLAWAAEGRRLELSDAA